MNRIPPLADRMRAPDVLSGHGTRESARHEVGPLRPSIVIHTCAQTGEERERGLHYRQALFLARQENWAELGRLIRSFDAGRVRTRAGTPVAEILCQGARADAAAAAIAAVRRGDEIGAHRALRGLEAVAEELSEDYGVVLVVALAHVDAGRAWRGDGRRGDLAARNRDAFATHFARASGLLSRFDPFALNMPTLAATRCALMAAEDLATTRVADAHEDAIDLDPTNPAPMRAMGTHMLPGWFGSYRALEVEARRTAARLRDVWGAGAYAWVYHDALAADPRAFDLLDADCFNQGLRDILSAAPGQHMANHLAAHLGVTLARGSAPEPGSPRARVLGSLGWIVRDHLREIHPAIWAAAARVEPAADTARKADGLRGGRARAIAVLNALFREEIAAGCQIHFDETGLDIRPGV